MNSLFPSTQLWIWNLNHHVFMPDTSMIHTRQQPWRAASHFRFDICTCIPVSEWYDMHNTKCLPIRKFAVQNHVMFKACMNLAWILKTLVWTCKNLAYFVTCKNHILFQNQVRILYFDQILARSYIKSQQNLGKMP